MRHVHSRLVLAATILFGFGCSSEQGPELATVTGIVQLDQQPLSDATVMFQPETGRPSFGKTDSTGRYNLEYAAGVPGAILGTHKVMIRTRIDGEDGQPLVAPEKLPKKYHERSQLSADVKAGENTHDFALTSK